MRKVNRLKDDARRHELREDWLKAIQSYEQVLAIGEQGETDLELPLYNRVGDLYVRIGRPNDAVRYYAQAADRYADAGLYNNAIALCNKALRYAPHHLDLLRKLGLFSASQGFLTDARRWFLDYAENAARQGRAEEALGALEEFANSTEDGEVRELLGRTLQQHGHHEKAVTELRHAYRMYLGEGNATRAEKVQAYLREIAPDVSLADEQPEARRVRTREDSGLSVMTPLGAARAAEPEPEPGAGSGTARGAEPEPEAGPEPEPGAEPQAGLEPDAGPEPEPDAQPEPEGAPLEGLMGTAVEDAGVAAEADVLEGFQPTSFETEPEDEAATGLPGLETGEPPATGSADALITGEIDISFDLPVLEGAEETPAESADVAGLEPTALGGAGAEEAALAEDELPEEAAPLPLLGEEEEEEDAAAGDQDRFVVDDIELPTFREPKTAGTGEAGVEGRSAEEESARAAPAADADEAVDADGGLRAEAEAELEPSAADEAEEVVAAHEPEPAAGAPEAEFAAAATAPESAAPESAAPESAAPFAEPGEPTEFAEPEEPAEFAEPEEPEEPEERADEFASLEDAAGAVMAGMDLPLLAPDGETTPEAEAAPHVQVENAAYIIAEVVGAARLALMREEVGAAVERLLTLHRQLREPKAYAHAALEVGALVALRPKEVRLHQVRVELAERSGERGLRLDAYLALAAALEDAHAPAKAEAIYEHVLEIEPRHATARAALDALQRRRQPEYVDLKSLLGLEEPSGETRYFVSENRPTGDEDSDFAAVLSQFKAKLAEHVAPEDADAHYDLGLAFKEMGLIDEAIEQFQVALRTGAARLRVYEELGDCFLQKQQYSVAVKLLSRALEIPTRDEMDRVGIYYHLGMAWERLGRSDEARDAYERVLGLDMGFRDVTQRLARL